MSPAEIVAHRSHLMLADIHAALAYYHDHREEIEADLAEGDRLFEELKAQQPSILERRPRHRRPRPMPRTIRFHLDEHCDPAIAAGLRRHGIDVTTTQEVGITPSAPASR